MLNDERAYHSQLAGLGARRGAVAMVDGELTRRALDRNLRDSNEVSLTIMGTRFDTAGGAVASLESDVATLKEGVTVTVGGRERTVKRQFGEWMEGVGDRVIPADNAIMVAAGGVRFTVAVSTTDDDAENLALGIDLAKRVAESR